MTHLPVTYAVTTEPTLEPINLHELKSYLRVTACDFDAELIELLKAARKQVENDTHRKLMSQTVKMYLDRFPTGNAIEIRLAPITGTPTIEYVDEDRTTQTFAASNYDVDLVTTPPRIVLQDTSTGWPDTEPSYPKAVTVTLTAGYASQAAVPVQAKLAIKQYAKSVWSGCEHGPTESTVYQNMIGVLRWTEYHCV